MPCVPIIAESSLHRRPHDQFPLWSEGRLIRRSAVSLDACPSSSPRSSGIFRRRKNDPLAKSDNPKLKFLVLEESLEAKLTEVLDKLAPYAESKTQTGILDDIIAVVEKILIKSALEKVDYVQVAAAQLLGINRNTLRKKMKDLKIKPR